MWDSRQRLHGMPQTSAATLSGRSAAVGWLPNGQAEAQVTETSHQLLDLFLQFMRDHDGQQWICKFKDQTESTSDALYLFSAQHLHP
jgi:hypothetical protein